MSEKNNSSGPGNVLQKGSEFAQKVKQVAKGVAAAASGNWFKAIIYLLPILIIPLLITMLASTLFLALLFKPSKSTGEQIYKNPEFIATDEFRREMIDIVMEGYSTANDKIITKIEADVAEKEKKYDYVYYTINNPLSEVTSVNMELYKAYSMFTVYKDREFLIEYHKNKKAMTVDDESLIYKIDDLKKMFSNKYDLLLSYSIEDQRVYYFDETGNISYESVGENSYSVIILTYRINVANIDNVGPQIFGLQDLTDSRDDNIPDAAKINEIEMAKIKANTIGEIFNDLINEYDPSKNFAYISSEELASFAEENIVTNINFDPQWKMSVPLGREFTKTSSFGHRYHPVKKKLSFHTGTDFGAPGGTPIYPVANGIVVQQGKHDDYGNYIIVYHGQVNGVYYFSTYNHMKDAALVSANTVVDTSTVLGYVGTTGSSTGNHLHLEIIAGTKDENGRYRFIYKNPELFLTY